MSLREFAGQVPMPYSTAREWRAAGRIAATATATGRWRVKLDQLPAVRAAYFGTPAPAPAPEVTP